MNETGALDGIVASANDIASGIQPRVASRFDATAGARFGEVLVDDDLAWPDVRSPETPSDDAFTGIALLLRSFGQETLSGGNGPDASEGEPAESELPAVPTRLSRQRTIPPPTAHARGRLPSPEPAPDPIVDAVDHDVEISSPPPTIAQDQLGARAPNVSRAETRARRSLKVVAIAHGFANVIRAARGATQRRVIATSDRAGLVADPNTGIRATVALEHEARAQGKGSVPERSFGHESRENFGDRLLDSSHGEDRREAEHDAIVNVISSDGEVHARGEAPQKHNQHRLSHTEDIDVSAAPSTWNAAYRGEATHRIDGEISINAEIAQSGETAHVLISESHVHANSAPPVAKADEAAEIHDERKGASSLRSSGIAKGVGAPPTASRAALPLSVDGPSRGSASRIDDVEDSRRPYAHPRDAEDPSAIPAAEQSAASTFAQSARRDPASNHLADPHDGGIDAPDDAGTSSEPHATINPRDHRMVQDSNPLSVADDPIVNLVDRNPSAFDAGESERTITLSSTHNERAGEPEAPIVDASIDVLDGRPVHGRGDSPRHLTIIEAAGEPRTDITRARTDSTVPVDSIGRPMFASISDPSAGRSSRTSVDIGGPSYVADTENPQATGDVDPSVSEQSAHVAAQTSTSARRVEDVQLPERDDVATPITSQEPPPDEPASALSVSSVADDRNGATIPSASEVTWRRVMPTPLIASTHRSTNTSELASGTGADSVRVGDPIPLVADASRVSDAEATSPARPAISGASTDALKGGELPVGQGYGIPFDSGRPADSTGPEMDVEGRTNSDQSTMRDDVYDFRLTETAGADENIPNLEMLAAREDIAPREHFAKEEGVDAARAAYRDALRDESQTPSRPALAISGTSTRHADSAPPSFDISRTSDPGTDVARNGPVFASSSNDSRITSTDDISGRPDDALDDIRERPNRLDDGITPGSDAEVQSYAIGAVSNVPAHPSYSAIVGAGVTEPIQTGTVGEVTKFPITDSSIAPRRPGVEIASHPDYGIDESNESVGSVLAASAANSHPVSAPRGIDVVSDEAVDDSRNEIRNANAGTSGLAKAGPDAQTFPELIEQQGVGSGRAWTTATNDAGRSPVTVARLSPTAVWHVAAPPSQFDRGDAVKARGVLAEGAEIVSELDDDGVEPLAPRSARAMTEEERGASLGSASAKSRRDDGADQIADLNGSLEAGELAADSVDLPIAVDYRTREATDLTARSISERSVRIDQAEIISSIAAVSQPVPPNDAATIPLRLSNVDCVRPTEDLGQNLAVETGPGSEVVSVRTGAASAAMSDGVRDHSDQARMDTSLAGKPFAAAPTRQIIDARDSHTSDNPAADPIAELAPWSGSADSAQLLADGQNVSLALPQDSHLRIDGSSGLAESVTNPRSSAPESSVDQRDVRESDPLDVRPAGEAPPRGVIGGENDTPIAPTTRVERSPAYTTGAGSTDAQQVAFANERATTVRTTPNEQAVVSVHVAVPPDHQQTAIASENATTSIRSPRMEEVESRTHESPPSGPQRMDGELDNDLSFESKARFEKSAEGSPRPALPDHRREESAGQSSQFSVSSRQNVSELAQATIRHAVSSPDPENGAGQASPRPNPRSFERSDEETGVRHDDASAKSVFFVSSPRMDESRPRPGEPAPSDGFWDSADSSAAETTVTSIATNGESARAIDAPIAVTKTQSSDLGTRMQSWDAEMIYPEAARTIPDIFPDEAFDVSADAPDVRSRDSAATSAGRQDGVARMHDAIEMMSDVPQGGSNGDVAPKRTSQRKETSSVSIDPEAQRSALPQVASVGSSDNFDSQAWPTVADDVHFASDAAALDARSMAHQGAANAKFGARVPSSEALGSPDGHTGSASRDASLAFAQERARSVSQTAGYIYGPGTAQVQNLPHHEKALPRVRIDAELTTDATVSPDVHPERSRSVRFDAEIDVGTMERDADAHTSSYTGTSRFSLESDMPGAVVADVGAQVGGSPDSALADRSVQERVDENVDLRQLGGGANRSTDDGLRHAADHPPAAALLVDDFRRDESLRGDKPAGLRNRAFRSASPSAAANAHEVSARSDRSLRDAFETDWAGRASLEEYRPAHRLDAAVGGPPNEPSALLDEIVRPPVVSHGEAENTSAQQTSSRDRRVHTDESAPYRTHVSQAVVPSPERIFDEVDGDDLAASATHGRGTDSVDAFGGIDVASDPTRAHGETLGSHSARTAELAISANERAGDERSTIGALATFGSAAVPRASVAETTRPLRGGEIYEEADIGFGGAGGDQRASVDAPAFVEPRDGARLRDDLGGAAVNVREISAQAEYFSLDVLHQRALTDGVEPTRGMGALVDAPVAFASASADPSANLAVYSATRDSGVAAPHGRGAEIGSAPNTIHVTIDRIDFDGPAVPARPPTPRPSPRMTLDRYVSRKR